MRQTPLWIRALAFLFTASVSAAPADEGMWLFTNPPRKQLQEKYSFALSDALLEQLQKASVLVDGSGSAAFVSSQGLVLTNQHVALRWLQELTTADRDVVRDGFHANRRDQEIPCPGLTLRVLWSVEDVTARVHGAIRPDMTRAQARKAREAILQQIEKESHGATGLASEVIALYHGGHYHLHRYMKYTDVRLVFAPEHELGRVFDICFLRAYDKGKPARVKHYLHWEQSAKQRGDLTLLSGFPGTTNRLRTAADLEVLYGRPLLLQFKWLGRWETGLEEFASQHPDHARQARVEAAALQNELTRLWNLLPRVERLLATRRGLEDAHRATLSQDRDMESLYREAVARIAATRHGAEDLWQSYFFLEAPAAGFNSDYFRFARYLVRQAEELAKPVSERLPEFVGPDQKPDSCRRVISRQMEVVKLADSLALFAGLAGNDADLVAAVLDGKSPHERARALIHGTRLDQPAVQQALASGGRKAVADSMDPMISLARRVDARARQVRLRYEVEVREPLAQAYALLTKVQQRVSATASYPDATGTLRLAFGRVQPFANQPSGTTSGITTLAEVLRYVETTNQASRLPKTWQAARGFLDTSTPLVLTCSTDGAPGNSGSPVVDRAGRLIGVAAFSPGVTFDLMYVEGSSGIGAVAAPGILEVLDKVYHAAALVEELGGNVTRAAVASTKPSPSSGSPPAVPAVPLAPVPPPPTTISDKGREENGKAARHNALIKALSNPDPEAALAAAQELRGNGTPAPVASAERSHPSAPWETVPATSPVPGRKGKAARHKNHIPALIKALGDPDQEVVQAVAAALAGMGADAIPPLIDGLHAKDAGTRGGAALALGKMGPGADGAVPALLKSLQDPVVEVRRHAARALAAIVNVPAVDRYYLPSTPPTAVPGPLP